MISQPPQNLFFNFKYQVYWGLHKFTGLHPCVLGDYVVLSTIPDRYCIAIDTEILYYLELPMYQHNKNILVQGSIPVHAFKSVKAGKAHSPSISAALDYILVLDFEANCVNEGKLDCQEIIEFPVHAINLQTLETEHTFRSFVRPEVHSDITEF